MAIFDKVTHVVFDLDGLLLDSETCYTNATNLIVNKYGKQFTWDLKSKIMGKGPEECYKRIIEELDLPLTLQEFQATFDATFYDLVKQSGLMPGADKLVKHLYKHGIPMAICTGSSKESFEKKANHFGDFFKKGNYFTHLVLAGDDPEVKKGKPSPDCFLICVQRFTSEANVPQPASLKNVLVFEDSPNGVIGAIDGQMQCVMVPDQRVGEEHKKLATLCIESLNEFKPELFQLPSYE